MSTGSAPDHLWRGITIRELTPPDASWHGSLVEVDVPAGVIHPVARSTLCETFYYCLAGALDFEAGGRQHKVSAGDLVLIEPGEWYSYRNDSALPCRLLSFNVPPYDADATQLLEAPAGTDGGSRD
jgi:mannose-6-phosphate isomerase-like protein (cupin superfamily)